MKKTILVVEDDPAIRQSIALLLEGEGYKADEATNGKEALKYLHDRDVKVPCLVLTDLMMPEMDGNQLIQCMQEVDKMMTIPVVVVSAAVQRTPPPGVPFVKKPFELEILMKYVHDFCGGPDVKDKDSCSSD